MDTQFIVLAARADRMTWRPSDRYGGGQFGVMMALPNETIAHAGVQVVLENQKFWFNVDVSQAQMGKPAFNTTFEGMQNGNVSFLATGGRVRTSSTGKQSLRFGLSGFRIRSTLAQAINRAVLDVRCVEIRDRWMKVSESYRIPKPKQGQSAFGERLLNVYLPGPMQIAPRQPVYIEGHMAARSITGDQSMYVIADLVA